MYALFLTLALAAPQPTGQPPATSGATTAAAQTPRPQTLVQEVRAALAAHDLARAEAIVRERAAAQGDTPDVLEAFSWLGRGAEVEKQLDRADAYADEAMRRTLAALKGKRLDDEPKLATALGAAIEVQALVLADRGARSEAILLLDRAMKTYRDTSLLKRIQKNINLLTLEGHPAPALDSPEFIGPRPPSLAELKGKVAILFFWAHWCPDCKIESPILAKLLDKYGKDGLAIVAPTQRYGYVAGGRNAPPDEELRYIVEVRDKLYPFLVTQPVPVSTANHNRYGVSTTPTVVILDRRGMVRVYHPGRMTEEELEQQIAPLLAERGVPPTRRQP